MKCIFENSEPGKVKCMNCGRVVNSKHPPHLVRANCKGTMTVAAQAVAEKRKKDCGCKKRK